MMSGTWYFGSEDSEEFSKKGGKIRVTLPKENPEKKETDIIRPFPVSKILEKMVDADIAKSKKNAA